jgi:hypothetical protein
VPLEETRRRLAMVFSVHFERLSFISRGQWKMSSLCFSEKKGGPPVVERTDKKRLYRFFFFFALNKEKEKETNTRQFAFNFSPGFRVPLRSTRQILLKVEQSITAKDGHLGQDRFPPWASG